MCIRDSADLLPQIDVLLDATPSGVPAEFRDAAEQHANLITIVQGGESADSVEGSFHSFASYAAVRGMKRIRVISCSSTGIARMLASLGGICGVDDATAILARRAADAGKRPKQPPNSLAPTPGVSHHAADVGSVLPNVSLMSISVNCSTTVAHLVHLQVEMSQAMPAREIAAALRTWPRVALVSGEPSTAELAEGFRRSGRSRGDRPEVVVYADSVRATERRLQLVFSVHMESITIPETIDCIRAALGSESDPWRSIETTDRALGIQGADHRYPPHPR